MNKVKFFGLIIILAVIFGTCYLSGRNIFIDLPSLVFVAGVTIGSLMYKHGKNGLMLWSKNISDQERGEIARTGSRACLASGLLGLLIGIVASLANLNDLSAIGPYLALSLLSLIYATMAYLIFFLPHCSREKGIL